MAKRKKIPDSDAVHRYLSRMEENCNRDTSELNKALLFYEMQAKATLIGVGYMTERGKWAKGYNADVLVGNGMGFFDDPDDKAYYTEHEKLELIAQKAVRTLFNVKRCRKNVSLGNIEEALLDMESIVRFSDSVRQIHDLTEAGRKPKLKKGILALITQIIKEPRNKNASAKKLFDLIEHRHEGEENAIDIDGYKVYYDYDEGKVTQISPSGKKEGILFDAFKNHVYKAKRRFLVSN